MSKMQELANILHPTFLDANKTSEVMHKLIAANLVVIDKPTLDELMQSQNSASKLAQDLKNRKLTKERIETPEEFTDGPLADDELLYE